MTYTLNELAALVQGQVIGDGSTRISTMSPIHQILPGTLVFADAPDKIKLAESSEAAALLVSDTLESSYKPLIKVAQPYQAFITLLNYFNPVKAPIPGVHPTAVIGDNVSLGNGVSIGAYVTIGANSQIGDFVTIKSHVAIGDNVSIGNHSTIHPHTTIYDRCILGARVTIHASTVIGSDGFGYTYIEGQHLKVPHIGHVLIEDDVEIGANTAVDRATLGATTLGRGTKIDNLVQIAHSVQLGKHNILCAFTGIAGSTTTGNNVIFAANVGVSDHVRIDDGVILGARTGVPPNKHLKEGNVYLGNPARLKDKAIELELSVNRIPLMRKNIKNLTEQVAALGKRLAKQEAETQ